MSEPIEITIYKSQIAHQPGFYVHNAFSNYYECTGPDGRRFTNASLVTLRRVLREKYGKVTVTVVNHKGARP